MCRSTSTSRTGSPRSRRWRSFCHRPRPHRPGADRRRPPEAEPEGRGREGVYPRRRPLRGKRVSWSRPWPSTSWRCGSIPRARTPRRRWGLHSNKTVTEFKLEPIVDGEAQPTRSVIPLFSDLTQEEFNEFTKRMMIHTIPAGKADRQGRRGRQLRLHTDPRHGQCLFH